MNEENRIRVYNKYDGRCAYCGNKIEYKAMQVDHMHPLCRPALAHMNGCDIHSFENLMPSCRRCNHYKRAKDLEMFRLYMTSLHERLEKIYILKVGVDYGLVSSVKPFDGQFYFEKVRNKILFLT